MQSIQVGDIDTDRNNALDQLQDIVNVGAEGDKGDDEHGCWPIGTRRVSIRQP